MKLSICLATVGFFFFITESVQGQDNSGDDNDGTNYLPCGTTVNIESDHQYYFKNQLFGGQNPTYTYLGGHRLTQDFKNPSCLWTFVTSENCQLMIHFKNYYPGDRPCTIQYVSVSDHQTRITACGYNYLPISFESTSNFVVVKHYRRTITEYLTQFEGYAICHSGRTGYSANSPPTHYEGQTYESPPYTNVSNEVPPYSNVPYVNTVENYTSPVSSNAYEPPYVATDSDAIPYYEYSPPSVSGYGPYQVPQNQYPSGPAYVPYPPPPPSNVTVTPPMATTMTPNTPPPVQPPPTTMAPNTTPPVQPPPPNNPPSGVTVTPPVPPPTTTMPSMPTIPNVPRAAGKDIDDTPYFGAIYY